MKIRDQRKRGQEGAPRGCSIFGQRKFVGSSCMETYNVPCYTKGGKSPQAAQAFHERKSRFGKFH